MVIEIEEILLAKHCSLFCQHCRKETRHILSKTKQIYICQECKTVVDIEYKEIEDDKE